MNCIQSFIVTKDSILIALVTHLVST